MKVNPQTLHKMAELARLEILPSEEAKMLADLNKILDWVDLLQELDTEGVEPLIHLSEEVNVFRPDEAKQTISTQQALINAPAQESGFFSVPKILD
jgi:aspartyl-tRNA(Asn)/glutamyl-tRNA(Gln) amidotransferase subunit C